MSEQLKQQVAAHALSEVHDDAVVGVGSGTTVAHFIQALGTLRGRIAGCVASSEHTKILLEQQHLPVLELNAVSQVDVYIDSADEVNAQKVMIKGGGGALTREKLISLVAKRFVGMVSSDKCVAQLGTNHPIALEVLPMARSYVARQVVKLGGQPSYRQGFVTDNHNIIIDAYDLNLDHPITMEAELQQICGVLEHGLFATRLPDIVYVADGQRIRPL